MNLWSFPSNILPLEHGAFPPTFKTSDNVDSNMELSLQHMTNRELSLQHLILERKSTPGKPGFQPPGAPKRFDGLAYWKHREYTIRNKTWRRKKGEIDGAHNWNEIIYNLRNKFTYLVEDIPKLWPLLVLPPAVLNWLIRLLHSSQSILLYALLSSIGKPLCLFILEVKLEAVRIKYASRNTKYSKTFDEYFRQRSIFFVDLSFWAQSRLPPPLIFELCCFYL